VSNVDAEVGNGHAELLHCVEVTDGHSVVLQGVEIDGDSEGDTAFVGAGIALTDGLA
jgi:hypothetical protein